LGEKAPSREEEQKKPPGPLFFANAERGGRRDAKISQTEALSEKEEWGRGSEENSRIESSSRRKEENVDHHRARGECTFLSGRRVRTREDKIAKKSFQRQK